MELVKLCQLVETDMPAQEKKLDAFGAPLTPEPIGRCGLEEEEVSAAVVEALGFMFVVTRFSGSGRAAALSFWRSDTNSVARPAEAGHYEQKASGTYWKNFSTASAPTSGAWHAKFSHTYTVTAAWRAGLSCRSAISLGGGPDAGSHPATTRCGPNDQRTAFSAFQSSSWIANPTTTRFC